RSDRDWSSDVCSSDLLGLFWKPATEAGALTAAATSVLGSLAMWYFMPDFPFMNRMLAVFLAALALAMIVSLLRPQAAAANRIERSEERRVGKEGGRAW